MFSAIYPNFNESEIQLFSDKWGKEAEHFPVWARSEEYIKNIYSQLKLSEMITNKNDLMDLENELMKYFLTCKNKDKMEIRKIRSVIFKSCKNHKFAEKIYNLIKSQEFSYFISTPTTIQVDLSLLSVQIENGAWLFYW